MHQRLVGVVRVSKVGGRDKKKKGAFMSPKEQRSLIYGFAKAHPGVEVVACFEELDKSGETVERDGLRAAMAMVMGGEADGIIVAKVDRYARSTIEGLVAVEQLREANKRFVAVNDGIHGGVEDDTPTGHLMLTILFAVAQWLRESLAQGWESAVTRSVENGVVAKASYGYDRDENTRRLVVHSGEAPWVRRMFELRAGRMSWTDIAAAVTAEGCLPHTGDRWTSTAVARICSNRVYLGEVRTRYGAKRGRPPKVKEGAHEAIVSPELWAAVRRADGEPPVGRARFPLSGLVRCASCGALMGGHKRVTKGTLYRYYECRRRFSWGECPAPLSIRAEVAEEAAATLFAKLFFGGLRADPQDSGEALDAALQRRADAEANVRLFLDSPETKRSARLFGQAWYDAELAERNDALEAADRALTLARAESTGVMMPVALEDDWPTLDDDERRGYYLDAFQAVVVGRGGRVRIWQQREAGLPEDLPGRGRRNRLCPIPLGD